MSLRTYQREARVACLCDWTHVESTMVVLFTGGGKTHIFASLAGDWWNAGRGRALVICPQIDLVDQAAEKIRQVTGVQPAIEQGHRWANEASWGQSPFVVASKQTLASGERYKRFNGISLVIIDECDLAGTEIYLDIIQHFKDLEAKVLGVTASPKRDDGIAMGNFFEKCSYKYGIADGLADGWLVPARVQCLQLESLDLSEVRTGSTGDFVQADLQRVMEQDKVVYEIAAATAQECGNLKTVVFCGWVREARAVAEVLQDRFDLNADWICGDKRLCSDDRRRDVLRSFTRDPEGVQIVCNVGCLTRGWDFPGLEHIVMARPTKSLQLFTQVFGRGTRPLKGIVDFEGSTADARKDRIARSAKPHFKLTDLRDNSLKHKLISPVDVLAGDLRVQIIARATKKFYDGKPIDVVEALNEAARAQEEAEQLEARRLRARVDANAKYNRVEVDPFNQYQLGEIHDPARRARKRRAVEPATDKQLAFLRWKGINTSGAQISKGQAMRMITQFQKGESLETVRRTNRIKRDESRKAGPPANVLDDINQQLLER